MDNSLRAILFPQHGEIITQFGVKRKVGTDIGDGWICIGNEKLEDDIWACYLEYQGESVAVPNKM